MSETKSPYQPAPATPRPWAEFCESGEWWVQQATPEGEPLPGDMRVLVMASGAEDIGQADLSLILEAVNSYDALMVLRDAVRVSLPHPDVLAAYRTITAEHDGADVEPWAITEWRNWITLADALAATETGGTP